MADTTRFSLVPAMAAVLLLIAGQAAGQSIDPTEAPLPTFEDVLADDRRALVIEATVFADGSTQFQQAFVSDTPPGTHVADPEHILIEWLNSEDVVLGSRNAWDPRWEFQSIGVNEHKVILGEALGSFDIPFRPDITRVMVTDQQTEQLLLDVDVGAVVEQFCIDFPTDPACELQLDDVIFTDQFGWFL